MLNYLYWYPPKWHYFLKEINEKIRSVSKEARGCTRSNIEHNYISFKCSSLIYSTLCVEQKGRLWSVLLKICIFLFQFCLLFSYFCFFFGFGFLPTFFVFVFPAQGAVCHWMSTPTWGHFVKKVKGNIKKLFCCFFQLSTLVCNWNMMHSDIMEDFWISEI